MALHAAGLSEQGAAFGNILGRMRAGQPGNHGVGSADRVAHPLAQGTERRHTILAAGQRHRELSPVGVGEGKRVERTSRGGALLFRGSSP